MEGLSLLSILATCIDLAQTIDAAVQKVRGARSELDEGLQTVSSTRRLLSDFKNMFESSLLPQDILESYMRDMQPIQCELESIQGSLNHYTRSSGRRGLAGLAWRIKWGRDADRHQRNLKNLNGNLNNTIVALSLKINFLALEAVQVGRVPVSREPGKVEEQTTPTKSISEIEKEYARAAKELQGMEWENIPLAHIQQSYSAAAKAFQIEEWSGPHAQPGKFYSSAITFTV